jgi:hypothetical protein
MSTITPTTSLNRPTEVQGRIAFETDTKNIIVYDGSNWRAYASDGSTGWSGSNTYSMNFDGTDDYLIGSPVTAFAQQGTISAWIKTTASGSSQTILNTSDATVDNKWLNLRVDGGTGHLRFIANNGGTNSITTGSTDINTGSWVHVAVTCNSSAYSLYVNGSAETLTNSNNDGTWFGDFSLTNISIGRQVRATVSALPFNGNIDEVAVWDSALSAAQITNIYKGESNGGSGGTNSTPGNLLSFSPKAWWRMGDGAEAGSGNIVYDMSSFSNNLTIVNEANFDNTTTAP